MNIKLFLKKLWYNYCPKHNMFYSTSRWSECDGCLVERIDAINKDRELQKQRQKEEKIEIIKEAIVRSGLIKEK